MGQKVDIPHTPVEEHLTGLTRILVKREDRAGVRPGPPFAKTRGLLARLRTLKASGVEVVGYVETSISMAGWGVAYLAAELGMRAVIFCPRYVGGAMPDRLRYHYKKWQLFGAEIRDIKAGRAKVNYAIARRIFREEFAADGVVLPLGLPFDETVEAVAVEAQTIDWGHLDGGALVVNVGSGTMLSGILKGLPDEIRLEVFGISGRRCSTEIKKREILQRAGIAEGGLLGYPGLSVRVVDPGYDYRDYEALRAPFPCNIYYDRKAWAWLVRNTDRLPRPILFWNIGA